ncbi:hypothetical protein ACGRH2_03575 [Vibrio barjaei]|uniref:Uncharacterized protein n=1 Tax=Vibrio barjaei TaxID=1676683 RepID=A0ABW7ID54_9VIBR
MGSGAAGAGDGVRAVGRRAPCVCGRAPYTQYGAAVPVDVLAGAQLHPHGGEAGVSAGLVADRCWSLVSQLPG